MTATDRLRAMLDERGVEWRSDSENVTFWNTDADVAVASQGYDGMLWVSARLTPEQAIAATLGAGTCHMSIIDEYETASGEEEYLCECSECGYRRWEPAHDLPLFCSKCGRKVAGE